MTQEINRKLHEALGKCWHDEVPLRNGESYCKKCKAHNPRYGQLNTDYCGDPRLVLREMMEREDWEEFAGDNFEDYLVIKDKMMCTYAIPVDLIMDCTGRLALLAIEWLKEGK